MSILDFFNRPPQAAAPAPEPKGVTPQAPGQIPGQEPTPQNATPPAEKSPLDEFSKLWQPTETPQEQQPQSIFNVDPTKIGEAASKLNFAAKVDPQLVQKALGGDTNAFMQAMNSVAQNAFTQMMLLNTQMTEQALNKHGDRIKGDIPEMLRGFQADEALSSNPLAKHSASQPLIKALTAQFKQQYPGVPARDIADHVSRYLDTIAGIVTGNKQPATTTASGDEDWSHYLNDGN